MVVAAESGFALAREPLQYGTLPAAWSGNAGTGFSEGIMLKDKMGAVTFQGKLVTR